MLSADCSGSPRPLICLGDIEDADGVPQKLVQALELCFLASSGETKTGSIRALQASAEDHVFSAANNTRVKSRRDFLSKDVIKKTWMTKHCELRPSVVLMLCRADLGWNPFEWSEKEAVIQSGLSMP